MDFFIQLGGAETRKYQGMNRKHDPLTTTIHAIPRSVRTIAALAPARDSETLMKKKPVERSPCHAVRPLESNCGIVNNDHSSLTTRLSSLDGVMVGSEAAVGMVVVCLNLLVSFHASPAWSAAVCIGRSCIAWSMICCISSGLEGSRLCRVMLRAEVEDSRSAATMGILMMNVVVKIGRRASLGTFNRNDSMC